MMYPDDLSPSEQDCAALWAVKWLAGHGFDSERVTGAAAVLALTHHMALEFSHSRTSSSQVEEIARRIPGHSCSELADICGGYLCECERGSWLSLDGYPPEGGCHAVRDDVDAVLRAIASIEWEELA